MRRSKEETRRLILDAAYGLFWRQGFLRVSMDDIAARAKITKRALYQHFTSKDELIAATLAQSSALALQRLSGFERPKDAATLIDAFFRQLTEWAAKPRWSGAGFTRVAIELADLRGHPARAIARKHKAAVEQWIEQSIAAAGTAAPRRRAREIMLLMEGAILLMLIHGDRSYAISAAQAAKTLATSQ
ncbi:MAG: TetR/AcrR family transcriptional regulator [Pseudolabrys sp.]